jgi:two-component system CheB/CheR fusion protein
MARRKPRSPRAIRKKPIPPEPGKLPRPTVLVVEDDADGREVLRQMLTELGVRVLLAQDGHEALGHLRHERPALALVDLKMPVMDGFAVARQVRADSALRHLRLVALTGYAGPEHHQACLAAGFDGHLIKPAKPALLARLVRSAQRGGWGSRSSATRSS